MDLIFLISLTWYIATFVVYITYNMGKRDLPDIYNIIICPRPLACVPQARAYYIRQIPLAHVITFTHIAISVCTVYYY